jgi:carbamoyltransferase
VTSPPSSLIVGHANSFHDGAIAVIADDIVYAEALERHMQCKRALGATTLFYSADNLQRTLKRLNILPVSEASVVYRSTWSERLLSRDVPIKGNLMMLIQLESFRVRPVAERQLEWIIRGSDVQTLAETSSVPQTEVTAKKIAWDATPTDHHLAHVGNAVFTSPFEECVVMIADGASDGSPLTFYHYDRGTLKLLTPNEYDSSVSLGMLYLQVTEFCGFDGIEGEEWKVMGLAAYGKPDAAIREVFDSAFGVRDLAIVPLEGARGWDKKLERVLGRFRTADEDPLVAADLAHNFQAFFTDLVLQVIRNAYKLGLSENLALAGGTALNSSTNGKIIGATGFKQLHVPSAPADDGNALGAALYEKHVVRKAPRKKIEAMSPYLGSWIDRSNLDRILSFGGIEHWVAPDEQSLCDRVAKVLAAGKIIGWVQGRAEFGPRALGNRSILADPRSASMKDEINRRVKFREQYRPVAPSILHEHGPEYFENYQSSPYMERTLQFREEVRNKVPAVVHVDGTGRLQSVTSELNPLFHRLLRSFHELTGIPLLLNTSFNVMGKPIVHAVTDAIATFYTTDLDFLVIENVVLAKRSGSLP